MGSTCEPNVKVIDASVGGLVWVRRRNGSWWPGRIMGLEELSEDCLVSPRSGTPVKLLGREDASVDWYNLEKSKRVKAFRCGEYDECIEKAKASAANSSKQAVKYARREDAILHALELEAARKSGTHKEICLKSDNCTRAKESQELSGANKDDEYMNPNDGLIEGNPTQELSQSGISFEDPNHANTHKVYFMLKKRRKTPNDSEDDGTEGAKRMRGLEDLGMGVKSKRGANLHLQRDGSHENVKVESVSLCESNIGNSLCNGSPVNSSKRYDSSLKRRRYQVANAYENLKRKNRRRQLTKVLESSMVAVPIVCDDGAIAGGSSFHGVTDSKVSVVESTESKKSSVSVVINNNSESTGASCEKETSLNASEHSCDAGVDAGSLHPELKDNEFSSMSEFPEDDSSDGLFDVPFVGEDKHTGGFSYLPASHSSLKLQSGAVGRPSNHCSQVGLISLRNEGLDESGSTTISHTNNANQKMEEGTSKWQSKGKRNSRFHSNKTRKSDLSDAFLEGEPGEGFSQWRHETTIEYGRSSENREITARKDSPAFSRAKYIGITPTTQVRNKESILRRHMRVSSLMSQKSLPHYRSRFTDHSSYAPTRNVYSDPFLFDVKLEVQASYRGRHVPLVSLMSKLNGKAIIGHPITVEVLDDGYSNCLMSSIDGCPTSSYSPKKSPKTKKCGLLSRKMRKLSSFSLPNELKGGERELLVEKASGPVVACVPLKVVFSRISEAVKLSTRPTLCTSNSTNP